MLCRYACRLFVTARGYSDLVRHFIQTVRKEGLEGKRFEGEALELMKAYAWPGNVVSLKTDPCLMALYPQEVITREIIEQELQSDVPDSPIDRTTVRNGNLTISQAVEENMRSISPASARICRRPVFTTASCTKWSIPLILAARPQRAETRSSRGFAWPQPQYVEEKNP